jgi:S-adenosylmethionine synthetase
MLTTGLALVAGEITTSAQLDIPEIVRSTIREIGYTSACGFDGDACAVLVALDRQSPDISQGVDMAHEARLSLSDSELDRVGAGDQGMMFGYATNETPELMPMPIALAHRLARQLAHVRKSGVLPFLRPDGKTQVTVRYRDGVPVAVEKVLISTQHEEGTEGRLPAELWENVVMVAIPPSLYDAEALRRNFYVNPTGRFVVGGPVGDAGLTGRKIIVDTYGASPGTAAVRSPARIRPRSTGQRPTPPGTSRRTSWRLDSPTGSRCRSRTRSASHVRCRCWSRRSGPSGFPRRGYSS